jgi:membrane-bound lytic murein transglycosylase A
MRLGGLAAIAGVFFGVMSPVAQAETTHTILSFDDLDGWAEDDHQAALDVFRETCGDLNALDWPSICALATSQPDARAFFELLFRPVLIEDGERALFTGYFEPELSGSRRKTGKYRYPIYRTPPELGDDGLWFTRADIEIRQLLAGRQLEIAWVDDPVDVFFLQVQGSGRIKLEDGSVIRVGYGGSNRHPYQSIGQELVRQGVYQPHQVSAQVIRNWVRRNPIKGADLLRTNRSYVFFRQLDGLKADKGPRGAMNRSITPLRSVAIDPDFVPLGAPVWLEKGGPLQMRRLMIAQDTGSAIKGAQRADIFYGSGDGAGKEAGKVRDPGRIVVLLPIDLAYARAGGQNQ